MKFNIIFILGFPCGSAGEEYACNGGDLGLIPGLGRSPREGKGYPLQYSGLENSMDMAFHSLLVSGPFFFFKLPDLLESQRWLAGFVGNEASC